jgi:hypothetical protein
VRFVTVVKIRNAVARFSSLLMVLSGIMYKTIETANALLQRDKVDFTLDLKVVDPLVFEQYPELRDVVRTACQTGEFGSIVDLGELC